MFLKQCRVGNLSMENYSYFHGLPTLTSPCIGKCRCSKDIEKDEVIGPYRKSWKKRFLSGYADMGALQRSSEDECAECRAERTKRHRVLTDSTGSRIPELHGKPFDSAPALYTFNVPRAFATNLRAREYAKQRGVQLSWCYARDVPRLPEDGELLQEYHGNRCLHGDVCTEMSARRGAIPPSCRHLRADISVKTSIATGCFLGPAGPTKHCKIRYETASTAVLYRKIQCSAPLGGSWGPFGGVLGPSWRKIYEFK